MRIHYFGHSAVAIEHEGHTILIDPFITGNPAMKGQALPESLHPENIFITHGHPDHVGDAVALAHKHDATVVAIFELATKFLNAECKAIPCGAGGRVDYPWGWSRFVPAVHSSSYNGEYAGNACGLIVNIGGVTFYHAGDTSIFGDMKLITELYLPEVSFLPIGGVFTMDVFEAVKAAQMINSEVVIPIHYNSVPGLEADAQSFKRQVEATCSSSVEILKAMDTYDMEVD